MAKHSSRLALVGGACLLFGSAASWAGILGSQHDLSTGGSSQISATSPTDQVCVFCHTPHGASTSAPAPLWNRALVSGTYQRYSSLGTVTLDGAEAPVGSISLACLSCHDGTQAMDSVINAPGSGGYNAGGAVIGGGAGTTMVGVPAGAPIPNLTQDLRDDHPISIQYAGGGCSTSVTGDCTTVNFGDKDFNIANRTDIGSTPIWWVDTPTLGTAGTRDKTDMFLYTRSDGVEGAPAPYVECGSCHDPHNADSKNATTVAFLRTPDNAGSKVCLACHNK